MIKFYQTLARMRRTLARVMWYLTSTNLPNTQTAGPGPVVSCYYRDDLDAIVRGLKQIPAGVLAYPDLFLAESVADGGVLGDNFLTSISTWTITDPATKVNVADPFGGSDAIRIDTTPAGSGYSLFYVNPSLPDAARVSVYLRADVAHDITIRLGEAFETVSVTTEWQPFDVDYYDLTTNPVAIYGGVKNVSTGVVDIYDPTGKEIITQFLPALPDETLCHPRTLTRGRYLNDIYPAREDSTVYAEGDKIKVSHFWYTCTTGGTSAASEPVGYAAGDATVTDGTAVFAYGGLYAFEFDGGALVEEARTNKVTCRKANPVDTTNISKGGDAAATLTVVDDTAELTAAGLAPGLCTSGKVYRLDNSAGVAPAYAQTGGVTGNTNQHYAAAWVRNTGAQSIVTVTGYGGSYETLPTYKLQFGTRLPAYTPTSTDSMRIYTNSGGIVYFILPQLEEGSFLTSPIAFDADGDDVLAAITRPATIAAVDSAGVLRANDFAVDMSVSSLGTQDGDVLWSSYTDASNYLSIGINGAAIEFTKVVGGVPATASVTYSPTAGLSFRLQANQSADGMILAIQELGAAWSAWGTDTTAAGKADAVIGPNVETGSEDAAKHYSGGYPNERILWLQPGVNPQTILEGLR